MKFVNWITIIILLVATVAGGALVITLYFEATKPEVHISSQDLFEMDVGICDQSEKLINDVKGLGYTMKEWRYDHDKKMIISRWIIENLPGAQSVNLIIEDDMMQKPGKEPEHRACITEKFTGSGRIIRM